MAYKEFQLDGVGNVTVYKRRGSQNIRLTVGENGKIKVTIPAWASFRAGVGFAEARAGWIQEHLVSHTTKLLREGQAIGKAHRLHFVADNVTTSAVARIRGSEIIVHHAPQLPPTATVVQKKAADAALRALRLQAKKLLKQRLDALAVAHDYAYRSLSVKQLKSRWGSCDQDKNIVLNIYLMQLPWHLIDYVIMHELAHTKVLRHGTPFWQEMQRYTPHAKRLRTELHTYQPVLGIQNH
ncbi:MAG: YgjP-like metallopeptidase domain-containing protein [Candidatus Saccharimonadales bacterium]